MPVSPQDFALWSRMTGNKYPVSTEEKAKVAPEVYNFSRNFARSGGEGEEKPSALENIGKAALIAGSVALAGAAAKDPRVQQAASRAVETVKERAPEVQQRVSDFGTEIATKAGDIRSRTQEFLQDLGAKRGVDLDVVRASGDVTPDPAAQQSRVSSRSVMPTEEEAMAAYKAAVAKEFNREPGPVFGSPTTGKGFEMSSEYAAAQKALGEEINPLEKVSLFSSEKDINKRLQADPALSEYIERRKLAPVGLVGSLKGDVAYAAPEATTDTTNSLFSSPNTPDNRVPKAQTFNPNSLTGQHNIEQAADNIIDNSAERVLSRSEKFLASEAAANPIAGEIQIDPQLSLFGPREPRATIAGQPYRYTQLERGPATQFGTPDPSREELSSIRGLGITPQLKTDQLEGIDISNFSSNPKVATAQKQALDIFQATGDLSFLRSAFGSEAISTPTTVNIGGRTVPTQELFTPFKTTEGGKGYEFEGGQIQRAIENLAPAEKFKATIQNLVSEKLGLEPGQTPTQEQLRTLNPSTIRLLRSADEGVKSRQRTLDRAEDFAALYKLRPEITEGVTQKPVVSSITGEYLGTRSAIDRPGVYTPELYRMRATGGIGRQEVGGVGRRREALLDVEGYSPGAGSELQATTVLYKDPATGNILPPSQVTEQMAAILTPIKGTAVEPQRIMGQQGRTYKGVSTQEIDPRSFDEIARTQLIKSSPERVTPEGLIYSTQAMGGKKAAELRAQQQAARQAKDYSTSIRLGAELAPEELGGTKSLPGIEQGEQLARASSAELLGAIDSGTPAMKDAAQAVLYAREQRQKQNISLKASQELNRILRSGRPNATREARAYLKGLQQDVQG